MTITINRVIPLLRLDISEMIFRVTYYDSSSQSHTPNVYIQQGVWRIPVEEIERAGSFGAHLFKTIYLLLQYLHEKRDYHLLYQLHTQLQRTPDQEKLVCESNSGAYMKIKSFLT